MALFNEVLKNFYYYELHNTKNNGDYVRECGEIVFEKILSSNVVVQVTFQTALSFLQGDYDSPSPIYEVYEIRIDGNKVGMDDPILDDDLLCEIDSLKSSLAYSIDLDSYLFNDGIITLK